MSMCGVKKTTWLTAPGRSIGSAWLCAGDSLSPWLCSTATLCLPSIAWSWFCTSVGTDPPPWGMSFVQENATLQICLALLSHYSEPRHYSDHSLQPKMNLCPLVQAGEMRWRSRFRSLGGLLASGGFTSNKCRAKQFSLCAVQQMLPLASTIWSC